MLLLLQLVLSLIVILQLLKKTDGAVIAAEIAAGVLGSTNLGSTTSGVEWKGDLVRMVPTSRGIVEVAACKTVTSVEHVDKTDVPNQETLVYKDLSCEGYFPHLY